MKQSEHESDEEPSITEATKEDWHDFWYNSTPFNPDKVICYIDNKQVNCEHLKEHYYETKY